MVHVNGGSSKIPSSKTALTTKPVIMLLSRKTFRSTLGIAIAVLALLYVYFMMKISHLQQQMHSTVQSEHGINGLLLSGQPSQYAMPLSGKSHAQGCGWSVMYYFVTASLPYNVYIFRQKSHGRWVVVANIFLIFMSSIQFDGEHCTNYVDMETDAIIASTNGKFWSESYTPKQIMDDNIRISFKLHDRSQALRPDRFAGVPGYMCVDQAGLPPSLSKRTVLNFTTTVATELKIAFIGDSISEQLAQSFDALVLGIGHERNRQAHTYRNGKNNINLHNCLSVSAPVRGGGASAFWRIATLMNMGTRSDQYMCEHKWSKWNEKQGYALVDHRYSDDAKEQDHRCFRIPGEETNMTTIRKSSDLLPYSIDAFDAVVMRIPHGWLTIKEITKERIIEAINLSNKLLGAQTIVISTLSLNNNVVTATDWEGITRLNQMVRDIAQSWIPPEPGSAQHILVQEWGNFTNQILWMNARHIKLTDAPPDFTQKGWEITGADFYLKRLSAAAYWASATCMICAEKTFPTTNEKGDKVEDCIRNKISRDGAHWCVETVAPRYAASIACLLGCVYNGYEPGTSEHDIAIIRRCEERCNGQFMSIFPVPESWIEQDLSLFSKSL